MIGIISGERDVYGAAERSEKCFQFLKLVHYKLKVASPSLKMIKFILMVNKQGQTRLAKYADFLTIK